MSFVIRSLTKLYAKLLYLYPARFRGEFAEEMQVMFRDSVNEAAKDGILPLMILCLRELGGLPFNVLREFWHEVQRKETDMATNGRMEPQPITGKRPGHWDALIGTLPFALFGIASMVGKTKLPFHTAYIELTFYTLVLLGLLVGLIKGFPRWAYSFLGWSLVFAGWWTSMLTYELRIFGYTMGDEAWGWRIWYPLFFTIGVALLWNRSIYPFQQLVRGIWEDWTFLSLMIYTIVAFMMLLYDENHSPYLIAFMIASTLAISASVWIFMRSTHPLQRFMILLSGFVAGLLIDRICETTWDFAAYYGLPTQPPGPWYDSILDVLVITGFWGVILLGPALVAFVRTLIKVNKVA